MALLPVLGFPHSWESSSQVVVGLTIIFLSIWSNIDKRLTLRAKAQKRQIQKRQIAESENQKEKSGFIQEESF